MRTRKLRFTRKEQEEHRRRLRQLKERGVAVGNVEESVSEPNRFRLTQVWHDFARVCEQACGSIGVVVYVNLDVCGAGAMISDSELIVPWDDFGLRLDDSEAIPSYKEVMQGSPFSPPKSSILG